MSERTPLQRRSFVLGLLAALAPPPVAVPRFRYISPIFATPSGRAPKSSAERADQRDRRRGRQQRKKRRGY